MNAIQTGIGAALVALSTLMAVERADAAGIDYSFRLINLDGGSMAWWKASIPWTR